MDGYTTLGFVGSGAMAEALLRGVLRAGLFPADRIIASDVAAERRAVFEKLGVSVTADNVQVMQRADIVVLSVKPQVMFEVLSGIKPALRDAHLLVSIAAGITTDAIEAYTGGVPVVRVMPNTPMLLGCGATAIAAGSHTGGAHLDAVTQLMETGGLVVRLEENMMDCVTALSGSGPAYFFYIVECLLKAAGEAGLERETAEKLLFQTVKGAAEMLMNAGRSPEKLREMVTSPGGTTEAALKIFQRHDLAGTIREGFMEALQQARRLRKKDT